MNAGEKDVLPGTAEKKNILDHLSWVSRIGIAPDERTVMEEVIGQAEALAVLAAHKAGREDPVYTAAPPANRTRPGVEAKRSALAATGQLLKSAPAVKGNYFKVASVLE